jgi:thiol-disulfide isomerase/thioredoxin
VDAAAVESALVKLLSLVLLAAALATAAVPAAAGDTAGSDAALETARRLLQEQKYPLAASSFRKADKLAGGACADCEMGLAKTLNRMGDHAGAAAAAADAVTHAGDEFLRAQAENERGLALLALGERDPKRLEEAAAAFRSVLEISHGGANVARVNLAEALLRLERDEEGVAQLKEYLQREPDGPSAARARALIDRPERARKRLMPDFQFATLTGEAVRDESYAGKVLLLDFWATWCAPCRAAVPSLRALHKKHAGEPFALLSVSIDRGRREVESFVAKHEMDWPQVWDQGSAFANSLGIHSYPTYLLIDHSGEIVFQTSGWGSRTERELRGRIAAAVKAAKEAPQSAAR